MSDKKYPDLEAPLLTGGAASSSSNGNANGAPSAAEQHSLN